MNDNILVVHGHPMIAELVRCVARLAGAKALCCVSFAEAKRLIEQWKPGLVLADLSLPDALGDVLPNYARTRGVEQVWGLGAIYRSESYRREPSRSYGTDAVIELCDVPRDLAPRLCSVWPDRFDNGQGNDHQSALAKICALLLRDSDRVESWADDELAASLLSWAGDHEHELNFDAFAIQGALQSILFSSGFGPVQSEAV